MQVSGKGWPRALAAVVTGAAAPSGRPAGALPWASPPAPAAQPQQPAARPTALPATSGASKPVAAAPALGKGPDKPGAVVLYCNANMTARAGTAGGPARAAGRRRQTCSPPACQKRPESFAAPGRAACGGFGAGRLSCRGRPRPAAAGPP
jgi:hypothetical protein